MSLTQMPVIFPGDIITIGSSPTLYRVTRLKQVKLLCEDESGKGWEARIQGCRRAPDGAVFNAVEKAPAPELALGMAVRWVTPSPKTRGVFVVIGQTAAGWKVARLGGGERMRYFHSIEASKLTPVNEINDADWS